MEFKDFNVKILRNEALRKILPLEIIRTYPLFSLENDVLTASFVGYRVKRENGAVSAGKPVYYLKIAYPSCRLLSFDQFKTGSENTFSAIAPRDPEMIRQLPVLCTAVLDGYDEKAEDLNERIEKSNALVKSVLEPDQTEAFGRYLKV